MNIAHFLETAARQGPERPALVVGDRTWTYGLLDREAGRLAAGLARRGFQSGERVCLHLGNGPEFVLAYYACQKLGLTAVALNVTYVRDELLYIIRDSAAAALLSGGPAAASLPPPGATPTVRLRVGTGDPGAVAFAALAADPPLPTVDAERDAVAAVLYTSATTGRPKGVRPTGGSAPSRSSTASARTSS